MRIYNKTASSMIRWQYGLELKRGLKSDAAVKHFAEPFGELNDKLKAAHDQTQSWVAPMIEKRIDVRWADAEVDQTLRELARKAESADGFPRGPIAKALFPNGLTAAVRSRGRGQIKPSEAVIEQLDTNTLPGVVALKNSPEAEDVRAKTAHLKTMVAEYDELAEKKRKDFTKEKAVRDEHLREVTRLKGEVTSAHPQNTRRQNLIFPPAPPKSRKAKEEEPPEEDDLGLDLVFES